MRNGALMMCVVAAAPHLFDDLLVASPELALVDVDLAAHLREGIRSGEEFRPRTAARPEFRLLQAVETVDASEHDSAVDELVELPEYVVQHDEIGLAVDPVVVDLDVRSAAPVHEHSEHPDYIVATDEPAADVGAAFPDLTLVLPAAADASELPDYIVQAEAPVVEVGVSAPDETPITDYPELPDLGKAAEALEETDAALRKIREQLVSEESSHRRRRVRRGFTVLSGLGAVTALAVFAFDVQQGVATLPVWLGF